MMANMTDRPHSSNSYSLYVIVIVLAVFGVLFYAYTVVSAKAKQASCMSNTKQLGLSFLLYSGDYDGRFPPAERWISGIEKYQKNEWLHCPAARGSGPDYAMNKQLSSYALKRMPKTAETVLMFDSISDAAHSGGPELLPLPGRHIGGNNFVLADGHIRWYSDRDVPSLKWKP